MPAFNILIVGGGLGGLVTALALSLKGHKVTVLESTSKLQTIGGGISIQPNAMRVLDTFTPTLLETVKAAGEVQGEKPMTFWRYNGEFVFEMGTRGSFYDYPAMNIHRANLQKVLLDEATKAGAVVHTNARVEKIDDSGDSPIAYTVDGRRWEADLIVGADGVKSTVRNMMYPDIKLQSYTNTYRGMIPGPLMRADPELAPLLEKPRIYWGPHRMVIGIPVQKGAMYSLECNHPGDTGTAGEWNKKGDFKLFLDTYSDFEPMIKKAMTRVIPDSLLVWKLVQLPELESWSWQSGKVVLTADAAHAVTPFAAQGHAMAIEDGAALAECLARAKSTSEIPQVLKAFETIRKPRVHHIGALSQRNEHLWQLPDGEEQRKRDEGMRNIPMGAAPAWDRKHVDETPGFPPDPRFWPWLYGHDVIDFTNRRLDELLK
ncbi:FAD-dependent monooxygenase OpS4 [Lachnellula suecica]|uniref:FAD-dependent monooxygenase OpS4 n=1 Tax=Lachnellula suecica TaxID=602035 RepID=A0A8T9CEH3_9HELO|nr:FAD-dependent monooxygenase OpS4 [Lachnellula suecica]